MSFKNDFNLLTDSQKQSFLAVIVVVALCFGIYKFAFDTYGNEIARTSSAYRAVSSVESELAQKSEVYDIIDKSYAEYTPKDILKGAQASYLNDYFKVVKPEIKSQVTEAAVNRSTVDVPKYHNNVSFIYIGNRSHAMIDGKMVSVGESTPSGLIVKKIENDRVLLQGKRSVKWVTLKF